MVAAHHAPRSLSGLAREEDEHGDEREFTECIAAWQETGGRTFPDFGRIVSRSPGHSHRSQDVEVRGELNVGGSLFRTGDTLRKARSKIRARRPVIDLMRPEEDGRISSPRSEGFGATLDTEGHYFVDPSGFLLRYALEYLRAGFWLLGEKACDLEFVDAVRSEANFYGLEGEQQLPVPRITEYVLV
eukprot:g11870.t2